MSMMFQGALMPNNLGFDWSRVINQGFEFGNNWINNLYQSRIAKASNPYSSSFAPAGQISYNPAYNPAPINNGAAVVTDDKNLSAQIPKEYIYIGLAALLLLYMPRPGRR